VREVELRRWSPRARYVSPLHACPERSEGSGEGLGVRWAGKGGRPSRWLMDTGGRRQGQSSEDDASPSPEPQPHGADGEAGGEGWPSPRSAHGHPWSARRLKARKTTRRFPLPAWERVRVRVPQDRRVHVPAEYGRAPNDHEKTPSLCYKLVADPVLGCDNASLVHAVVQLAAQMLDVYPQIVRRVRVFWPPHLAQ